MFGNTRNMMGAGFSAGQANALTGTSLLAQTATGSTQGTAFPLNAELTEFTTVAASTGALLPSTTSGIAPLVGDTFFVINNGANALAVYPPTGGSIGTAAANTALSVPANKTALFIGKGTGSYWALLSA